MQRLFLVICLSSLFVVAESQENNSDLYALTNTNNYVGVSIVDLVDPYLSLLSYSGLGVRFESDYNKFFNPAKPILSSYGRASSMVAMTINPEATASIIYVGADMAWGVLYENRYFRNFILKGGGNVNLDFGFKMNSRNVNNPVNIDVSTNLNAMLDLKYLYPTRKRTLEFGTKIEFPVVGCMFAPYPGLSYYELSSSKSFFETIHFSSLHNKQGIKQDISILVPLNTSTLKFGVRLSELKYMADNYQYRFNEFSLLFGVTYDYIRFTGKKSNIPVNFISPSKW